MKKIKKGVRLLAILSLVLGLVLIPQPSFAAAELTLNPASGTPGTVITITGTGFATNSSGMVWFDTNGNNAIDGEPQIAANTNSSGVLTPSVNLTVPAVAIGTYQVRADIPAGGSIEASASFYVITPSSGGGGEGGGGGGTTPTPPLTPIPSPNTVDISLQPPTTTVAAGETFNLAIQATAGEYSVSGLQAFLSFDPLKLAVVDSDAAQGVQIATGTDLPVVLLNSVDNTIGKIDYSAGKLGGEGVTFPSGTFTVATIQFKALTDATATPVTFGTASPRKTIADCGGYDITRTVTGGTVSITADAPLALVSQATSPIIAGQTFKIDVNTNLDASQPVDGVDAFINFDPAKLEVIDADDTTPGVQIGHGSDSGLPTVLVNVADNTAGTINFSTGKLGAPFPAGSFRVATIGFLAKAPAPSPTPVSFSFTSPRKSVVDYGGATLTGMHTDTAVPIITGVPVDISVVLHGDGRPDSGWVVPLTVKFFNTSANVLTDIPLYTFNLTTSKTGTSPNFTASAQCPGVAAGTYDVSVVSPHTLTNVRRNTVISEPSALLDTGTLFEGNANDNNIINISDFGILALTYGKSQGEAGFDARADFDRSGIINIGDFGLLAINYTRTAPVVIP